MSKKLLDEVFPGGVSVNQMPLGQSEKFIMSAPASGMLRSYKTDPHGIPSLLMKYLVHRMENKHRYASENPDELDRLFLEHHSKGNAGEKHGVTNPRVLGMYAQTDEARKVARSLLDHKAKLRKTILREYPEAVQEIDGAPHVPLYRGLKIAPGQRQKDHALASYTHWHGRAKDFGIPYAHMVPLDNVWYSYDHGPAQNAGSEYGSENEILVSPHQLRLVDHTPEMPDHWVAEGVHQYEVPEEVAQGTASTSLHRFYTPMKTARETMTPNHVNDWHLSPLNQWPNHVEVPKHLVEDFVKQRPELAIKAGKRVKGFLDNHAHDLVLHSKDEDLGTTIEAIERERPGHPGVASGLAARASKNLTKSLDPQTTQKLAEAHDETGPSYSEHPVEESSHPSHAAWKAAMESPNDVKNLSTRGKGISQKAIFKVGSDTYMMKPYFNQPEKKTSTWVKTPIQGWATITNRDLYHAGGIPHLVEDVHVGHHDGQPYTVHKFAKGARPYSAFQPVHEGEVEDHRKILAMDYLTGNIDRHSHNIMSVPVEGRPPQPLAIDHERSFQYLSSPRHGHDENQIIQTAFGHALRTKNSMPYDSETAQWWANNSQAIRQKFHERLKMIKDPDLKQHMQDHFDNRADHLDYWSQGNMSEDLLQDPIYIDDSGWHKALRGRKMAKKAEERRQAKLADLTDMLSAAQEALLYVDKHPDPVKRRRDVEKAIKKTQNQIKILGGGQ